ncbi:hypothetical protein PCANC_13554 [Puccinia coronata f. sp. avenae]|uniref:Uncharacterized protein n=1 Tax=Puccinia coronata f. sp. avenae TaxID=200324 RepID=A0A2N5UCQ7_9BASI|nr:hypothetical protein PCASD_11229 [Puccinia coronata f. sp. avenae]PLW35514.1 hypothetical protein PCANC_13554 [Puccinia coronata f. sp. avenae]
MLPLSRLTRTYERAFKHYPSLTLAITNGCLKCFGDFLAQFLPSVSSEKPFVLDLSRSLRFFLFGFLHGPCVGKWHEFLERRIPLTAPRGGGPIGVAEEEDMQLIETEKSLTTHRPISMRSRSTVTDQHVPTLRSLTGSDSQLSSPLIHAASKHKPATGGFRFLGLVKRILLDQLLMAPIYTFLFISLTGWFEGLSIPEIEERLHQLYWYLLTSNWKIWPLIQIFNFSFMPLQYRVPWQGSCGVLWTVFLSLSTHPTTHMDSHGSGGEAAGATLVGSALSKLFNAGQSNSSSDATNNPSLGPLDPDNSSSTLDPSSSSSQFKRKNSRVIG